MHDDPVFSETAPRSMIALPARTVLHGNYEIGRVLGKGGFGITYAGLDTSLQMPVAIKEYLPTQVAGRGTDRTTVHPHGGPDAHVFERGLDAFLDEGRTLARFTHPHIVRVLAFFKEHGTGYLVMPFIDGQTLAQRLKAAGGSLPPDEALAIMLPVLDGLQAVHEEGFLHRDVKPQNIFLPGDGNVILIDFGAARIAFGQESQSLSAVLTPGYAPFEQYYRKGNQGPWTDVYAAAATLYKAITGTSPPESPERNHRDPLRPAHELNPAVGTALSAVLTKGLAPQPELRYQTVEAFEQALKGAQAGTLEAETVLAAYDEEATLLDATLRDEEATLLDTRVPPRVPPARPTSRPPVADGRPAAPPRARASAPKSRTPLLIGGALGGLALLAMALMIAFGGSDPVLIGSNTFTEDDGTAVLVETFRDDDGQIRVRTTRMQPGGQPEMSEQTYPPGMVPPQAGPGTATAQGAPEDASVPVPPGATVIEAERPPMNFDPLTDAGCDLRCALEWSTTASSTLPDQGTNRYAADLMEDRDLSTAWVEGRDGFGVGERITVIFRSLPGVDDAEVPLTQIALVNGYAKDDGTWRANTRVRRVKLNHNGQTVGFADLLDTRGWQIIPLPTGEGEGVVLRPGDTLELEIMAAYPGAQYDDTAISEIAFYGGQ